MRKRKGRRNRRQGRNGQRDSKGGRLLPWRRRSRPPLPTSPGARGLPKCQSREAATHLHPWTWDAALHPLPANFRPRGDSAQAALSPQLRDPLKLPPLKLPPLGWAKGCLLTHFWALQILQPRPCTLTPISSLKKRTCQEADWPVERPALCPVVLPRKPITREQARGGVEVAKRTPRYPSPRGPPNMGRRGSPQVANDTPSQRTPR